MELSPLGKEGPGLGSFAWDDPLLLHDRLTEDEKVLADSARRFAQDVVQPRVIDVYRDAVRDPDIFQEMGEMGLPGATISDMYGGLSAPKIGGKLSVRASINGEIVVDGVDVPKDALLPHIEGLEGPFGCLNRVRYGHRTGCVGCCGILLACGPAIRSRPRPIRQAIGANPAALEEAGQYADRDCAGPVCGATGWAPA